MPWRCDVAENRVSLISVAVAAILPGRVGWHLAQLGHESERLVAAESASAHPAVRVAEQGWRPAPIVALSRSDARFLPDPRAESRKKWRRMHQIMELGRYDPFKAAPQFPRGVSRE